MPYGTIKVDTITFTDGGIDKSVSISGLTQNPTFTGNVTVTGTVSGATVRATTISGVTISGTTVNAASGVFTTQISGAVVVAPAGLVGAPSVQVGTGATVAPGLYGAGTDQLGISTGGSSRLVVDSVGQIRVVTLGSAAAPALVVGNDLNTGLYSPGADQVAISTAGTGRLFVDASGNVGIGTSSPGSRFNISSVNNDLTTGFLQDGATTGYSAIQVKNTSGNTLIGVNGSTVGTVATNAAAYSTVVGTLNSTNLHLITNDIVRATVDTSGNVGIGVTSPGFPLDLVSVSGESVRLRGTSGTDVSKLLFTSNTAGTDYGYLTSASGYLAFGYGASERARIDSSGRLLVGTSTARGNLYTGSLTAALQVEGTSYNTSSLSLIANGVGSAQNPYPILYLGRSRGTTVGSNTVVASGDEVGGIVFTGADGTNLIPTASIESFVDGTPGTNDMPGRLVFSTTADGASSPTERMRIANTGSTNIFASTANVLGAGSNQAAGTTYYLFYGAYNASSTTTGTTCFLVFTNGNVQNTNNSYAGISDAKLKENIVDATSQWSDIKALQVRKYNFKEGQTHTQIGLIAQEVELVSPGLVTESPDRDAEGNNLGTVTKSVNYSVLYMKAVKALQEAMERIEQLEAKVAALESA